MHSFEADCSLLDRFWQVPAGTSDPAQRAHRSAAIRPSAPIASVQVWVKTGSIHEGAQLGAGLSHFLEHMLFKGTTRRAGREISQTIQAHGGHINAYTTFDRTVYYVDLPCGAHSRRDRHPGGRRAAFGPAG